MLSAIAALRGGSGALAYPSVAIARVMLWATVNDVIVFTSVQRSETIRSSPRTKSRWSTPSTMCWMPS